MSRQDILVLNLYFFSGFPFRMKELSSWFINPLVGMGAKKVPLGLDQSCR